MTTSGNFSKVVSNGVDLTGDGMSAQWKHAYQPNQVMMFGTGIKQKAVGIFDASAQIEAYINSSPNAQSAFNLLRQSTVANDVEYLTTLAIGQNMNPVMGDAAYSAGFTLQKVSPNVDPKGVLTFQSSFVNRGRVMPLMNVMQNYSGLDNAAGLTAPAFWDNGTNSALATGKGGGSILHVTNPTGTAAGGNFAVPVQPTASDTIVVNGVTFTWVASLTGVAGQVKIGATAQLSAQNLLAAVMNWTGAGVTYVAVSAANQLLLQTAYYSLVTGASNTVTVTYKLTGTAGNAFTLTKTGTAVTVSGGTLTGGVTGDVLTFTVQTATTSGGSYTTAATHTLTGQVAGSEYIAIPSTTIINEFVKCFVTGGTGQNIGFMLAFGRFWN